MKAGRKLWGEKQKQKCLKNDIIKPNSLQVNKIKFITYLTVWGFSCNSHLPCGSYAFKWKHCVSSVRRGWKGMGISLLWCGFQPLFHRCGAQSPLWKLLPHLCIHLPIKLILFNNMIGIYQQWRHEKTDSKYLDTFQSIRSVAGIHLPSWVIGTWTNGDGCI